MSNYESMQWEEGKAEIMNVLDAVNLHVVGAMNYAKHALKMLDGESTSVGKVERVIQGLKDVQRQMQDVMMEVDK